MNNPFCFYTQLHLIQLLGIRTKNLIELLAGIKQVPPSSIYYHTHRILHQHQTLFPEPPNDFAYWITNVLNIKELGETFASVNIIRFKKVEELRSQFIKILNEYVIKERNSQECPEGQEFHFMKCRSFVLPTLYVSNNLKEFVDALEKISINSLFFHIFEARIQLERDENDFSIWFKSIGKDALAKAVARLDPYNITLEGLRRKIIALVKRYG